MSDIALILLCLCGAVVLLTILYDALDRDPPPDLDRCGDKERKARMEAAQKAARERMKSLGIKSLLDGRPGWRKVVVMSEPTKPAKVTSISRRRA